jgi:16S rRNA (cytidine1402-2'-O)-methyltransferase
MPGILYVVATPIGNLEDVTFRALRVLRDVSLIAAEDTRRTSRLLQHYSISTPTTSVHEHNERRKTPGLVARLLRGESVALVSDAGTPVVSDPGAAVVSAAHAAGIRVEPIPGPSAAVAALSASGLGGDEFVFLGFPPSRSASRKRWLARLTAETRPLVLYEAPHRIRETLADLEAALGDRTVALCRELTKAHEELVVRPISAHLRHINEGRGEYTLVISPNSAARSGIERPSPSSIATEFGHLTADRNLSRRAAIRQLAAKYGLTSRDVYTIVEKEKGLSMA